MTLRHDLPLPYVLRSPARGHDSDEFPLVIVMHGRGADANDLADIAPAIDGGYRFLFPNARKPWEAYPGMAFGFSWFDGWPPQGDTLVQSRRAMLDFIDASLSRYPTPAGKLIVSGFSQGALMAFDVGLRTEKPVAGIVAMSGALHEGDMPPLRTDRPVLIVHGVEDEVIPVLAARRTRRVLEAAGVPVEYHEFAMGHFVTTESLAVISEFMRKCLSG